MKRPVRLQQIGADRIVYPIGLGIQPLAGLQADMERRHIIFDRAVPQRVGTG